VSRNPAGIAQAARQLARWIDRVELLYRKAQAQADFRMIVEIPENSFKIM
jgi:hypothetical protein